jgi:3-hydroxyacyl-[acyl-carrier-protein] dehydratase
MPPEAIFDVTTVDLSHVLADRAAIRAYNLQRLEMEHLDAIVLIDPSRNLIVGYKDVRPNEFWVPGHFPNMPLMPGVLMCEAAAQLCSYYAIAQHVMAPGTMLGFGGMDEVRFRGPVRPGDRLVLVAKVLRLNRRQSRFNVQGFVGDLMVFHADIIGIALAVPPGA